MFKPLTLGVAASIIIGSATSCYGLVANLVDKTERATALVVVTSEYGPGFGSAFCISASGLFATDAHVVLPVLGRTELVLHPGEKDQKVIYAHIVGVDAAGDLAILQAENFPGTYPVLPLGDSDKLVNTENITAFGYPFGDELTLEKNSYPTVSVNSGKVTSLRKKNGELDLVQIDAAVNPGNSGGPIVDENGNVVGLVEAGLPGAGINFAIPVARLQAMMAKPLIDVEPGAVRWIERSLPHAFTMRVTWLQHPKTDYQVELSIKKYEKDTKPQILKGQTSNGQWYTTFIPVENTTADSSMSDPALIYNATLTLDGKTAATAEGVIFFTGTPSMNFDFLSATGTGARGRAGARAGRGNRVGRGATTTATAQTPDPDPLPIDAEEIGSSTGQTGTRFRLINPEEDSPIGLNFVTTPGVKKLVFKDIRIQWSDDKTVNPGNFISARPGYVLGGLNTETSTNLDAVQAIFIRKKTDGTLDPSDTYTSDWIGYADAKPVVKTLGGKGEKIIGVIGNKNTANTIDDLGLVQELPPGKAPLSDHLPLLAQP